MADQFEQAFADIAYGYLQEKVPNLMQFLVGFEVIDKDDKGTRGLGMFAIKIGERYLYAPVFFLNGELKPLEMLWLKDKDIFVPLDEEWVAYLLKNKPLVLGEASEEMMPRFDSPNLDLFSQPPMTGKHVSASARAIINKMGGRYAADSAALATPTSKALEFLAKAGNNVKQAFLASARRNLPFLKTLGHMYNWEQLTKAAALDVPVPQAREEMDAKVASLQDPELLRELTPAQREKVYRGELVFSSPAGVHEKWAQLYDTQFQKDIENPSRSGVYQVFDQTGDTVDALVLLAPHATEKYGSKKATVIEVSSKRFVRAPVSRIWVKKTVGDAGQGGEPQFGTIVDQLPEKLLSERDGGTVGGKYVLVNEALNSSAPFEIDQIWTDSKGLTHYRVIFTEGETPYTEDTNSTRAGANQEPRTDNALGAEQSMGLSTVMTLIPATSGSKSDKIYALGDELMVPKTFKLLKLANPTEGAPKLSLGSDAAIHDQIFGVTKRAEFQDRLGRLGLRYDGMLFSITHDGAQRRDLTKVAAAEALANTFLMRPDQVLLFLKQAESARGRVQEIWALQAIPQADVRTKRAAFQRLTGTGMPVLPGKSPIGQSQLFRGQSASQQEQEDQARKGASRRTALRAKQSQMMPLSGGIPDPMFTSDNGVAPGGQQFYQEELLPLPNNYGPPPRLGGDENMYTGPSSQPGGPPPGQPPEMDTGLAMQAAGMGQQTVFDHSMLGSLAQITDVSELVNQYLPDLEAALDKLGRLLFLYWWHQDQFKESFGITKMKELEDRLRNVFKTFGELVLDLKQKERGRLEMGTSGI